VCAGWEQAKGFLEYINSERMSMSMLALTAKLCNGKSGLFIGFLRFSGSDTSCENVRYSSRLPDSISNLCTLIQSEYSIIVTKMYLQSARQHHTQ
jgi:hypothetical protein